MIDRLLQRGSMFVFSTNQLRALLDVSDDFQAEALLDLGEALFFLILSNSRYDRFVSTCLDCPNVKE